MLDGHADLASIKLIAALGNPGSKYTWTPHNAGFILADLAVRVFGLKLKTKWLKSAETYSGEISGQSFVLIKPQSYMNLSGEVVQPASSKISCPPEQILVIHDEVDLDWGKLKVKFGGGTAGHNGLKSIVGKIGSDFWRLRIGIGKDPAMSTSDYVLRSKVPKDYAFLAEEGLDALELFLKSPKASMNEINRS